MYQNFFNTIYSLIAYSGVCSFYFIHKKLTQFCMYIFHSLEQRLHATSDKPVGMQTVLMLAACWLSDGSQFFNQHLPQVWQHGCDCHFST